MIIPLYNLQAHNVMTNVVLDAGTDARIAKFMKRGLEVIGLAVLDPMEVWNHGRAGDDPLSTGRPGTASARNSVDNHDPGLPAPQTPESSAISLGSAENPTPKAQDVTPAAVAVTTPQSTPTGAKKFFGKLFRRKDSPIPGVVEPSDSPSSSPLKTTLHLPIPSSPAKRSSLLLSDQPLSALPPREVILQPAVLGIQPTLDATSNPPQGRPTAYVWTVTKWLKGTPEGLLGGVKGMFHGDRFTRDEPMDELERQVEVRFEWTRVERGGKRKSRRSETDRTVLTVGSSVGGGDKSANRRHSTALTNSDSPSVNSLHEKKAKRSSVIEGVRSGFSLSAKRSMDSARSRSPKRSGSITTNTTTSETGGGDEEAHRSREGNGEESDPEDSEVPWTCTLHVARKPTGPPFHSITHTPSGSRFSHRGGHQIAQNFSGSPTPVRQQQQSLGLHSTQSQTTPTSHGPPPLQQIKLKVATVSPTPHHPKVVSFLKIPFPLPDIEVSSVNVRKRIVTPVGISRPADPSGNGTVNSDMQSFTLDGGEGNPRDTGLVLTAEDIKDVVASTALWLVVREAMGGVGRDRRKGDGWRLRG